MIEILSRSWALLLGMMLLMVGNGIQGTLLGVRGAIEEFSTFQMSLVMSAYFVGFLGGSHYTPLLIRRVGHVRVFAALGSLVSAILILFPSVLDPWAWIGLRVLMGFCFSGVYVTAESWLNNATSNENRGKALSLYMIVQMTGVVAAQGLVGLGDPSGFILFVIPSVLVSVAFAPILLSATPTPTYETTKPMKLRNLFALAPLSCVGIFLLGGVYSATFGMASVYGGIAGLSTAEIATFVTSIYVGGMLCQFPIGYISDRMDRRLLILIVALLGAGGALLGAAADSFALLLVSGFVVGGTSNPLYGLVIAYANDYLDTDDMPAASGQLVFLSGAGAIGGPVVTGWMMDVAGPVGFFLFIFGLLSILLAYGFYRSFRRPAPSADETGSFVPVTQAATVVTIGAAQDVYASEEDSAESADEEPADRADEEEDIEPLPAPRGAA